MSECREISCCDLDPYGYELEIAVPVVDFIGDPLNASSVPIIVLFTDLSTNNPTSWLWDFGDGSTSTEQNPQHEYADVGSWTVTLTATNEGGSSTRIKVDYVFT